MGKLAKIKEFLFFYAVVWIFVAIWMFFTYFGAKTVNGVPFFDIYTIVNIPFNIFVEYVMETWLIVLVYTLLWTFGVFVAILVFATCVIFPDIKAGLKKQALEAQAKKLAEEA
ncbi:MAG: hypothetical protein P1Q69_07030 [Candidatus Thorarchaeota archaeon]|nr:hypothetical protein [Candidatus Thorarchaeota archaeon]